jgi:hypothetical protein
VGGSAANDLWAVGHRGDYSDVHWTPLFMHWNGAAWTAVPGPTRSGRFYAVAALSRSNAWAVGEGPVIAHWDGARWRVVASPRVTFDSREPARLLGVAALSPNDVWAAGLNWHDPTVELIEHWNGQRWRVIPGVPAGRHPLHAVAALSSSNIWAAGDTAMEHWNGSRWALAPAPAGAASLAAVSAGDIWAVGGSTIEHWDSSRWRLVPGPASGERFTSLTGITALSPQDVWAVGFAGHTVAHDGYAEHPFVEHWNGTAWRVISTPPTGRPDSQLLAVTSLPTGQVWAVGFAGTHRAGSVHPLIERYRSCR